jgi:hypothetical protein
MAERILIRRDTTNNWQSVNPVLSNGELGIEIKDDNTRNIKIGDGSTSWNSLDYFFRNSVTRNEFDDHINNFSAHNATDTPTSNRIAMYNDEDGLKSDKVPVDDNDVLRKNELTDIDNRILDLQTNKEPLKYIADDEIEAENYSAIHTDIMVFYPEE